MRRRFRIRDHLYAAETFPAGGGFEVRVFCLEPRDGYFRRESAHALLRLKGNDEAALLQQAVHETGLLIKQQEEPADSES
ncbi:MAG TPA: hypothetical protein VGK99_22515 [Acidobacteriota bacterium]